MRWKSRLVAFVLAASLALGGCTWRSGLGGTMFFAGWILYEVSPQYIEYPLIGLSGAALVAWDVKIAPEVSARRKDAWREIPLIRPTDDPERLRRLRTGRMVGGTLLGLSLLVNTHVDGSSLFFFGGLGTTLYCQFEIWRMPSPDNAALWLAPNGARVAWRF